MSSTTRDTDALTERLDDLVLARIVGSRRAPRVDELAAATRRFAPATLDAAAWRARIAEAHARLVATGAIDAAGAPLPAAAAVWGRLGSRTAIAWQRLVERVIPALALGVGAADTRGHARLADRDAWAAAIVARALALWPDGAPPPTLAAVCDAHVWRTLGLRGAPKRTPPEIRAHFVGALIETGVDAAAPPERLVRLHAASLVGAPRPDLRALRDALGRRWLTGATWTVPGTVSDTPDTTAVKVPGTVSDRPMVKVPGTVSDTPDTGLPALARAVQAAAGAETLAVFGDRKVFIAAIWRSLRGRPPVGGLDLEQFKRALVAAHRAGLISLARADLVGVMDPDEVAASETISAEARYHFVVREEARGN